VSRGRRISRRERTEPDPLTLARRRDFRAASTFQSPWVILAWWNAERAAGRGPATEEVIDAIVERLDLEALDKSLDALGAGL